MSRFILSPQQSSSEACAIVTVSECAYVARGFIVPAWKLQSTAPISALCLEGEFVYLRSDQKTFKLLTTLLEADCGIRVYSAAVSDASTRSKRFNFSSDAVWPGG